MASEADYAVIKFFSDGKYSTCSKQNKVKDVYSSELVQEPEAAPALAPAQALAPGPAHTPEAAPAQEYAHTAAPPPASAPVFTPVHAQNPAPALAHAPASPNHLPPFAMHSINISGFAFLPPGTPPDPMLQRQSTPVGRNEPANQLYEWSSLVCINASSSSSLLV